MALPVNLYEVVGRGMPLRYAVAGCITGMPECRTEGRKIEDLAEAEDAWSLIKPLAAPPLGLAPCPPLHPAR